MKKIISVKATEIKDSRQKSTVRVEIETTQGVFVDSCPSGASTGSGEAATVDVQQAIKNVNEIIAKKLKGKNPEDQREIDEIMIKLDGTENKSKLGANAILAVSMAVCRAGADAKKTSLYKHIAELTDNKEKLFSPLPMFNILNGGRHANNNLDIQEFMIVPCKKTMQENLIICNDIFLKLKEIIKSKFGEDCLVLGDEGGFAAPLKKTEQALFLLKAASETHIKDIKFALDCAASEFYKNGKYILEEQELSRLQLMDFYKNLIKEFSIISIEDPFSEDDWQGFEEITKDLGKEIMVVGDDLTTTNIKRIKDAYNKKAINAVLIKLNQIGTVSETIDAVNATKGFGWKTIVSHRSGETMDDFIADLAVGVGANFIKAGSPAKEERMVKYNRIIKIEEEMR